MNKKIIVIATIFLIALSVVAGTLLAGLASHKPETSNLYTYPISVGEKTYTVTLETNWNAEPQPTVTLINESESDIYGLELYFRQGVEKTISYNITFPTALLDGNITLTRKYYEQDPDLYSLSSNGTCTSLSMTFDFDSYFSGNGYFFIEGTT